MSDSRVLVLFYDVGRRCLGEEWLLVVPRPGDVVQIRDKNKGTSIIGQVLDVAHQITSYYKIYPRHHIRVCLDDLMFGDYKE